MCQSFLVLFFKKEPLSVPLEFGGKVGECPRAAGQKGGP
jgi:hypothetical protein